MKAKTPFCFFLSFALLSIPSLQVYGQSAGGHITRQTCSVCGTMVQNCPYKGKHPKPTNSQPKTGTLSITSTPSDAAIKIDGEYMGTTPLTLKNRKAGTYKVTISAEGYETVTKSVTVTAGKTATCSASLKKKEAPQPVVQQPTTTTTTTTTTPSSSSYYNHPGSSDPGSQTNPTIRYLFTHPMLFLDGDDINLSRSQIEKKLAQLHGSGWYMEKTDAITYLYPNGTTPTVNGRNINKMYCSYYDGRLWKFVFQFVDKKFQSYDEAKQWTDNLVSQIRAMGFPVNESEDKKYPNYYYKGTNGGIRYEVRLPTNYFNQLYIELFFDSGNAVTALSNALASKTSYSQSSYSTSNTGSSSSSAISKFFPYYDIVFGKTKFSDLPQLGYEYRKSESTGNTYYYSRSSGITVYDNNNDQFVDEIVTSDSNKLPEKWTNLGFDWGLSYNQCMSLVRQFGFSVKVTTEPTVQEFSGRKTLKAGFKATSPDGLMSILFSFQFGNESGEGYSVDSRNSLEFIHIKYLGNGN